MQIVCDQCQAVYDVDPPTGPFARDQNLVFRCTACGNSIPIRSVEPLASEEEKPVSVESVPSDSATSKPADEKRILLRQQGKVYQVRDEAMLQRWIAERRIWRTDEVSLDGSTWTKAEAVEGCSVFFDLVDQAEQTAVDTTTSRKSLFAKPQPSDDPLAAMSVSTPDPNEVTEVRVQAAPPMEAQPEAETEPDEDTSVEEVEVQPAEPIRLAVEAIPEEVPSMLPNFDDPTLDLEELEQDDFFTGESDDSALGGGMASSGGDYDDGASDISSTSGFGSAYGYRSGSSKFY